MAYLFNAAVHCCVYESQAAMLVAHLDGPQTLPRAGRLLRTLRSLTDRGWLIHDPQENSTRLTESGKPFALRSAEMLAARAPSIVPDSPARETVPA